MKTKILLSLIGLFGASALQAATLLEFNFDQRIDNTRYSDSSGNGHILSYNRAITRQSDYPFASSHPDLAGLDYSAQNRVHGATSGTVSNPGGINLNATNQFTMEGWINVEAIAFYGSPTKTEHHGILWSLSYSNAGDPSSGFSLRYTPSGEVQATFNAASQPGGNRTINTGVILEFNEWYHLAYVKTSNSVEIYVNGTLVSTLVEPSITSRALPTSLTSIVVGSDIYGRFDDFRLSDTALTADQLGFHKPFSIPEPSTTALTILSAAAALSFMRKRR